jgi:peptidoglycan/LPS O-acetylase OafA/YrhL
MYSQPKRVEYIDSIRGLAALFVLLSHTGGAFAWPDSFAKTQSLPFVEILFDGKAAVAMFFVLSGFVLSRPYVYSEAAAPQRKIFLPTFYLRRFTRIWLPWFFAFGVSIFARKYCFQPSVSQPPASQWLNQFWHAPLTVSDFFRQCLFMLHDSSRQLLTQDWSLGVELKGSLMIPLFLMLATVKRLPWLTGLALLLCLCVPTGHYYVSFILGVLIAQHGHRLLTYLNGRNAVVRIGMLLAGLVFYQAYTCAVRCFGEAPYVVKYGWLATALGCALILLSALNSSRLQAILNHKPVVFLGKISYSVYLLQFIVILCLLPPALTLMNRCGLSQPVVLYAMTLLVSVGGTMALATLSYRCIELPAIQLGHSLTKAIQFRYEKAAAASA